MKTITNIITLLSLLLTIGCTNSLTSTEEMSTQDKIALMDSIISQNNNYQLSIESVDLYGTSYMSFSAERIITNEDSVCFFIFRSKKENSHAIILPSETDRLCSKRDSIISIVSTPINYKKSFTISNNGGLSVTAVTDEDYESKNTFAKGLIVREYNDLPSNFRYTRTLGEVMEENKVSGISDIDTRELTKAIRNEGSMKAIIVDNF